MPIFHFSFTQQLTISWRAAYTLLHALRSTNTYDDLVLGCTTHRWETFVGIYTLSLYCCGGTPLRSLFAHNRRTTKARRRRLALVALSDADRGLSSHRD